VQAVGYHLRTDEFILEIKLFSGKDTEDRPHTWGHADETAVKFLGLKPKALLF